MSTKNIEEPPVPEEDCLGLVPTESTSSDTRRQGGITKCGNPRARWLLVECSQHDDMPQKVSKELSVRQAKLDRRSKEVSWRAQNRPPARFTCKPAC